MTNAEPADQTLYRAFQIACTADTRARARAIASSAISAGISAEFELARSRADVRRMLDLIGGFVKAASMKALAE